MQSLNHSPLLQTYFHKIESQELKADPYQKSAMLEFDRLLKRLESPKASTSWFSWFKTKAESVSSKGLYLYGGVGRGKTMLMDLFYAQIPEIPRRRVHFHAFMQEIHQAIAQARNAQIQDPIPTAAKKAVQDIHLLCFDEFHVNDITDAMILGRLFEQFIQLGVVVVATSNRKPEDLYKDGLNRNLFLPFIELLQTHMTVFPLDGSTDYRLQELAKGKVYFTPLNTETTEQITDLWRSLTDEVETEPDEIIVHGRKLYFEKTAQTPKGDIAWSSFADLCAKPLGPADFLEIAARFSTLILSDVPQLTPLHANEAKRFVTLIDALYEAKRRLIISAAAPAETLYQAGKESFEFERAASRLLEMRSEAWLKHFT